MCFFFLWFVVKSQDSLLLGGTMQSTLLDSTLFRYSHIQIILDRCLTLIKTGKYNSEIINISFSSFVYKHMDIIKKKIKEVSQYYVDEKHTNKKFSAVRLKRSGLLLTAAEVESINICSCDGTIHQAAIDSEVANGASLESIYLKRREEWGCLIFSNRLESDICEPNIMKPNYCTKEKTSGKNPPPKNVVYIYPTLYAEIPYSLRNLINHPHSHFFTIIKLSIIIFRIFNLEQMFLKRLEVLLNKKFQTTKLEKEHVNNLCCILSETDVSNSIFNYLNMLFNVDIVKQIKEMKKASLPQISLGDGITLTKLLHYSKFLLGETQRLLKESYSFQLSPGHHRLLLNMVYGKNIRANNNNNNNNAVDNTTCKCFCHEVKTFIKSKYYPKVKPHILQKQNDLFQRLPMVVLAHGRTKNNTFIHYFIPDSISTLIRIYPNEQLNVLEEHLRYMRRLEYHIGANGKYYLTNKNKATPKNQEPKKILRCKTKFKPKRKIMKWFVNSCLLLRCNIINYSLTHKLNKIPEKECSFPLFNQHIQTIHAG